jgi:hypothetical protein
MTDNPPHIPRHAREPREEFPDVNQDDDAVKAAIADERNEILSKLHGTRPTDFYDDLMHNPEYARESARFKAIVVAYAGGEDVQDICDNFGVTRTEVALVVRLSGVRRGMGKQEVAPEDLANLYALLYAAQLEIESLRAQLAEASNDPRRGDQPS